MHVHVIPGRMPAAIKPRLLMIDGDGGDLERFQVGNLALHLAFHLACICVFVVPAESHH